MEGQGRKFGPKALVGVGFCFGKQSNVRKVVLRSEDSDFMLIITATVVVALVIVTVVLTSHKPDESQLSEPRASLPMVGIQIVCGNCAGDDARPRRTYLDRSGNCSQCGGQSYLLASSIYGNSQGKHDLDDDMDRIVVNAKVLPFDPARVNKIAV
jgi:hypothetical protein